MSGSRRNYRVGIKNNWRRSVWNEILRRTDGSEKTHPILYLAGPQDLDRAVAMSKGVPSHNLIAIDLARDNVERVKKRDGMAIDADVAHVVSAWPQARPVSAVLLDFCSGLTGSTADALWAALSREPFWDAVVMVNFLRGRDKGSNDFRSDCYGTGFVSHILQSPDARFIGEHSRSTKNRALLAVSGYSYGSLNLKGRMMGATMDSVVKEIQPWFFTYKSGVQVFDSVVLGANYGRLTVDMRSTEVVRVMGAEWIDKHLKLRTENEMKAREAYVDLRRRITAVMAVRTRKMRDEHDRRANSSYN